MANAPGEVCLRTCGSCDGAPDCDCKCHPRNRKRKPPVSGKPVESRSAQGARRATWGSFQAPVPPSPPFADSPRCTEYVDTYRKTPCARAAGHDGGHCLYNIDTEMARHEALAKAKAAPVADSHSDCSKCDGSKVDRRGRPCQYGKAPLANHRFAPGRFGQCVFDVMGQFGAEACGLRETDHAPVADSPKPRLSSDFRLLPADAVEHPAHPAFVEEMTNRAYGESALCSAWSWFKKGWDRRGK